MPAVCCPFCNFMIQPNSSFCSSCGFELNNDRPSRSSGSLHPQYTFYSLIAVLICILFLWGIENINIKNSNFTLNLGQHVQTILTTDDAAIQKTIHEFKKSDQEKLIILPNGLEAEMEMMGDDVSVVKEVEADELPEAFFDYDPYGDDPE